MLLFLWHICIYLIIILRQKNWATLQKGICLQYMPSLIHISYFYFSRVFKTFCVECDNGLLKTLIKLPSQLQVVLRLQWRPIFTDKTITMKKLAKERFVQLKLLWLIIQNHSCLPLRSILCLKWIWSEYFRNFGIGGDRQKN